MYLGEKWDVSARFVFILSNYKTTSQNDSLDKEKPLKVPNWTLIIMLPVYYKLGPNISVRCLQRGTKWIARVFY